MKKYILTYSQDILFYIWTEIPVLTAWWSERESYL